MHPTGKAGTDCTTVSRLRDAPGLQRAVCPAIARAGGCRLEPAPRFDGNNGKTCPIATRAVPEGTKMCLVKLTCVKTAERTARPRP